MGCRINGAFVCVLSSSSNEVLEQLVKMLSACRVGFLFKLHQYQYAAVYHLGVAYHCNGKNY